MDFEVSLPKNARLSKECIEAAGGDELVAKILYSRGIDSPEKIKAFLYQEYYNSFAPSDLGGVDEAIDVLLAHVKKGATVCIYGDYDVDGITSLVLLKEALDPIVEHVTYHIPHRFTEGYGMSADVIKKLAGRGLDLIITCDCGISNAYEVKLARELGIDVIITDHHTPPEILPPANAIVNPKLFGDEHPLYPLPGVGVAYIFIQALYERIDRSIPEGRWLDLVALGIIADVVPVLGECRYLLKKGLPYLLNPERIGLRELFRVLKGYRVEVADEEDIAFQVSPRINAAGRMGSAYLPAKLLLERDSQKAAKMAAELDDLNRERKLLQNQIFDRAVEMVEADQIDKGILVLYNPAWHEGVLGIVAGKVAEQYRRPCICLTLKKDRTTITGSARSVGDISIYDLLVKSKKHLKKFGGHKMAAGMSLDIDQLESFASHIQGLLPIEEGVHESLVDIDVEIGISHVDKILLERVEKMVPFGHGFPKPVFKSRGVDIISSREIGSNHQKLVLSGGESNIDAIWWWANPKYGQGTVKADIVYTMGQYASKVSLTIIEMDIWEQDSSRPKAFDYDIVWHDQRGRDVAKILAKHDDGIIYYEGLDTFDRPVVDRYGIEKCDKIILLSPPPAPALFREIMLVSGAKEVVLGFSEMGALTINHFLSQLQTLLKHVIVKRGGSVSLQKLSTALNATEKFIELSLIYLKEIGFIDYIEEEGEELTIYRGNKGRSGKKFQSALINAFNEEMSFKRYISCQEICKIESVLKRI